MLRSQVLLACGVILAAAGTVAAQDKVDIAWKFEKDKVFYQQMETTTSQNMKVQGLNVDQTQKQTFYFSWKAVEEKADKSWLLKQRIEGVKIEITIAGNQITFDSTAATPAAQNNPLADFFSKLVGSEFDVTVGPDRKVTSVDAKGFVDKLGAANPQMQQLIKQILNDNALKQMADPTFAFVPPPGKQVAKGDTWERTAELSLGPIGSYKNNYKYTYEGQEDQAGTKLDKIKAEITMNYSPPAAGEAGLPFRIKEATLKSGKESGGTILFDSKAGRLQSSDLKLELSGELTIDIGGTVNKVELKQSQQTKVTTLEKLPFEPKKPG